ncbi:hypothetical protein BLA39750_01074 [Burkholderia lata]|uniref:Uncharacterized protein n=1 Tax=Burkholderia lata (strain ATCC 17760 / DSM 23089 / LMG 22485 / NCIMB 9086 / R18194 / 383) TaxID=482957 RepID=A0A6P2UZE4_BURL3|nr:hypothetical protein [Burkholderia lata]VWC79236.1 hypothetical protein BLA39750_01074 [Burkholderia lata]
MNTTAIAHALKQLDWTGTKAENMSVIHEAIATLEHASLSFLGDVIGYVSPEVAKGPIDWETATLYDVPETPHTVAVYISPVTAANAIGAAAADAYTRGLYAGLRACIAKESEARSQDLAGDASGASACQFAIEALIRGASSPAKEAIALNAIANLVIGYGDARAAKNPSTVQSSFFAILSALAAALPSHRSTEDARNGESPAGDHGLRLSSTSARSNSGKGDAT